MRKPFAALLSVALLFAASPSQGALVPRPGSGDPRIYVVDYDPAQVVELHATMGYQTFIEFTPDEHIENVAVGDATGWQITPNRAANLLFVKPMSQVPTTNMTVVTNYRHYSFELSVRPHAPAGDRNIVYTLRFQYPEAAIATVAPKPSAPEPPPLPKVANAAYSYDGSARIVPARVFDDGHATYFEFRDSEAYPAIFALEADRSEVVVNTYMRNGYVVADLVGRGFVLRQGNEVTHVYNDGFHVSVPGPQSPRRRAKTCWICL
ncbi:MAG TPA: P-type conjugative transfer protein VirB9 [Rhizomicrobium sp.]|nr:P-type conjugative transfer protein VirB9 [Rhizomicrobium sp.]